MHWELRTNFDRTKEIHVKWDDIDLASLQYDNFDLALLRECDESMKLSDKLLALEMLVRKMEKANDVNNETDKTMHRMAPIL